MKRVFRPFISGLALLAFWFSTLVAFPVHAYYFNQLQLNRSDFAKIYNMAARGQISELKSLMLFNKLNIDAPNPGGDNGVCVAVKQQNVTAYRTFRLLGANPRPNCSWRIGHFDEFVSRVEGKSVISTKPATIARTYKPATLQSPRPISSSTTVSSGISSSAWWWTGGALLAGGVAVAAGGGGGGGSSNGDSSNGSGGNDSGEDDCPSIVCGVDEQCIATNACGGCTACECPKITCSADEICTATNACGGCTKCTEKCSATPCAEGCYVDLPKPGENYSCRAKNQCGGCEEWLPIGISNNSFSRYFIDTDGDNEGDISKEYLGDAKTWGGLFSYMKSLTNRATIDLTGNDGAVGIMSALYDDLDTALLNDMEEGNADIINEGDININANKGIGILTVGNNNTLMNAEDSTIDINGYDGTGIAGYGQNVIYNEGNISLSGQATSFLTEDDIIAIPLSGYFLDTAKENSGIYLNSHNSDDTVGSHIFNSGSIVLDYESSPETETDQYISVKGISAVNNTSTAQLYIQNSGDINIGYRDSENTQPSSANNLAVGIQAIGNGIKTDGNHDSLLENTGDISLSGIASMVGIAAHNIAVQNSGSINITDSLNGDSKIYGIVVSGNSQLIHSGVINLYGNNKTAIAMIGGNNNDEEGTSVKLEKRDDSDTYIGGDIEIIGSNNSLDIGEGVQLEGNIETKNYYNNSVNNSGVINAQSLQATSIINNGEINLSGVSQITAGSFSNNGTLKLNAGTEITPIYVENGTIDISGAEFLPDTSATPLLTLHVKEESNPDNIYNFKMCNIDLSTEQHDASTVLNVDLSDRTYDKYNLEIGNWKLAERMTTALGFSGDIATGGVLDLTISGPMTLSRGTDGFITGADSFTNNITITQSGSIDITGLSAGDEVNVFDVANSDYTEIINGGLISVNNASTGYIIKGNDASDFVNNGTIKTSTSIANDINTFINNGTVQHFGNGLAFANVSAFTNYDTIETNGQLINVSSPSSNITNGKEGVITGSEEATSPLIYMNGGSLINQGTIQADRADTSTIYMNTPISFSNTGTISNSKGTALSIINSTNDVDKYTNNGTIKGVIPVYMENSSFSNLGDIEMVNQYGIQGKDSNIDNKEGGSITKTDTTSNDDLYAITTECSDSSCNITNDGTIELSGGGNIVGINSLGGFSIINNAKTPEKIYVKATAGGAAIGIQNVHRETDASGTQSDIFNYGIIEANANSYSYGIKVAGYYDVNSGVYIKNGRSYSATDALIKTSAGGQAYGIYVDNMKVKIENNSEITSSSSGSAYGIYVNNPNAIIDTYISNSAYGTINVDTGGAAYGIYIKDAISGDYDINNEGNIYVETNNEGAGIHVESSINTISNRGNITVDSGKNTYGIRVNGEVNTIENDGEITVKADTEGNGIEINDYIENITNSGKIAVESNGNSYGIYAPYANSVDNYGEITVNAVNNGIGIFVGEYGNQATDAGKYINHKQGSIIVNAGNAKGIMADNRLDTLQNDGHIEVNGKTNAYGIYATHAYEVINTGTIKLSVDSGGIAYGIYAPDAHIITNTGTIDMTGCKGSTCISTYGEQDATDPANASVAMMRMVNRGNISSNSAMNFGGENNGVQTTVLGANGTFKAPELSGTLFVASDTTIGSNEDEYVEENALVADKIDVNVESESIMFASSLVNNSGSANVLMSRNSFNNIMEDQKLAEYLEQNYQAGNRVDLFDTIKNASSYSELKLATDKIFGGNFFPLLALQNQQRIRNFGQTMEDLVLDKKNLKDERSVVVFNNYYNDQDNDKSYIGYEDRVTGVSALFDKMISRDYRFGAGVGLYNAYTDFDNDDSRRDSIVQFYLTNLFDYDNFGALIMPFGGYGHGEYKRYANGVKNEPGFDVWYAGINNRVFLKNNIGGWKFEPTAELNISNIYQNKIKEKRNTTFKANNSLSAEIGVGAYVKKDIDFGEKGNLSLSGGVMCYRELNNNTYDDVKASIIGMDGEYNIKGYDNDLNRAELSLKAEYKINSWSIYGELMQNFGGDNDNTIYNAGIKLAF